MKSERAYYFDAGATQKIAEGFSVGIDGFYKSAHSVLDEGQFGQALILSSFNYKRGEIYGGELTANYDHEHRRVRICDGVELQFASASDGSARSRR